MISPRADGRPYFAALFLSLVALAWIALIVWGLSPYAKFLSHTELGEVEYLFGLESISITLIFVLGWTIMTTAMMLPTSLPLFDLFRRLVRERPNASRLVALLVAGYMTIWSAFGLAAHIGDRGIHALVGQISWLQDNPWALASGVLLLAGLYQFSPLKYMCLEKCRSPFTFITERWHGGREQAEAFGLGIHHGLFCVGCCWSLMLLMFAVGVGNVAWMLALSAVMAVEKNMPWGRRLSVPLGIVLLVCSAALVLLYPQSSCAHHVAC